MADLLKGENSGVIVGARATDFMAGGETGVPYREALPSGDWTDLKPTDEWQRRNVNGALGYDTNSCTDFSMANSIEAQVQRMMRDGELPQGHLDRMAALGYVDEWGRVNFSDWYNAITAGTTDAAGNTLYATWDAARRDGMLPQSAGFSPNDFASAAGWYGARPTADQYQLAREFNRLFDVSYEWVSIGQQAQWDLFDFHLKQAPLHVLVPTGSTWNAPTVAKPSQTYTGVNHAVTLLRQTRGVSHTVVDHYAPFLKDLEWGYFIPYALKGVVTVRTDSPASFHYTFGVKLTYGAPSSFEVNQLQRALSALGYLKAGVTGPFGPQTRAALGVFQTANGIKDPGGQGVDFGPTTRAAMNKALLALP